MSTVIRNGLILRNATLDKAFRALDSIRPQCISQAQQDVATTLNKARQLHFDLALNITDLETQGPPGIIGLVSQIYDAREEVLGKGLRNPTWDFTLDVVLIPSETDVLALYYLENDAAFTEALKRAGFRDFHFQNRGDKPEGIDDTEWADREAVWKSALRGLPPCEVGVIVRIVSWEHLELTHFNANLMASCVPTIEQRRLNVAQHLCELEHDHLMQTKGIYQTLLAIKTAASARASEVILADDPMPQLGGSPH